MSPATRLPRSPSPQPWRSVLVGRLVLASSLSVYDWSRIRAVLDEDSPTEQDPYARDGYAVSKVW